MNIVNFSIEAIVVGVVFAIIGIVLIHLSSYEYHKNHLQEVGTLLFTSGAIGHILFELVGANAWYCKNGHACNM